jgi:hypothetical protein
MLQNAMQGKKLADVVSYLSALQQSGFNLAKCAPPQVRFPLFMTKKNQTDSRLKQ